MDEPAIEKLGAAPLHTGLGEIAALKSKSELGKYLGHEHLALRGGTLFGFGSDQDFADAIAGDCLRSTPADSAFRTAITTPRPIPSRSEIRGQYAGHVQRMFELDGRPGRCGCRGSQNRDGDGNGAGAEIPDAGARSAILTTCSTKWIVRS